MVRAALPRGGAEDTGAASAAGGRQRRHWSAQSAAGTFAAIHTRSAALQDDSPSASMHFGDCAESAAIRCIGNDEATKPRKPQSPVVTTSCDLDTSWHSRSTFLRAAQDGKRQQRKVPAAPLLADGPFNEDSRLLIKAPVAHERGSCPRSRISASSASASCSLCEQRPCGVARHASGARQSAISPVGALGGCEVDVRGCRWHAPTAGLKQDKSLG